MVGPVTGAVPGPTQHLKDPGADSWEAARRELGALRAARRGQVRQAAAAVKQYGQGATFGLLVIPVDFADARLPSDWQAVRELGPRLFPSPKVPDNRHGGFAAQHNSSTPADPSLADYFHLVSQERCALQVVLAPIVHLPQDRRAYSDVGWQGYARTRRLAAEAIAGARDAGVPLRLADNDGPDRQAGTLDDDGDVDGVLILHTDTGDENDPTGLIQALQFYLDDPVNDRGTLARVYAVASLWSGLGIWAHETAHLFGLEERYDVFLPSTGSELAGRGGLGIFSLMAAGAFGVGGGRNPALLDAYSAGELGWCDIETWDGPQGALETLGGTAAPGRALRVWTHGQPQDEYFLLEARGGAAAWPLDRGVPSGLLITHVDHSLPERAQSSGDLETRHIRVAVVEADGGGELRRGLDAGGEGDLFGDLRGAHAWTPDSVPASDGYGGPTEVALTEITLSGDGGVRLRVADASTLRFGLDFRFADRNGSTELLLVAQVLGMVPDSLAADVVITRGAEWGSFAGGDSLALGLQTTLVPDLWTAAPPLWLPAGAYAEGASTAFRIRLRAPGGFAQTFDRTWSWRDVGGVLDFAGTWPGQWQIAGTAGTTWHRWAGPPYLTADGSPVLACTGVAFGDHAAWPDVSYTNGAEAALLSGPLPSGAGWLRLVHAMDGELVRPGVAWDAGVVEIVAGDGSATNISHLLVTPGRRSGVVAAEAASPLHGEAAIVGEDSCLATGPWPWRIDLIPIGSFCATAQPPCRLRLRFASDGEIRGRGWFVARLEDVTPNEPRAFPVAVLSDAQGQPAQLAWSWHWEPAVGFEVEASDDNGLTWGLVWTGTGLPPGSAEPTHMYALPLSSLATEPSPQARRLLRVVAVTGLGRIGSPAVPYYAGGAPAAPPLLSRPYPNPADERVRFVINAPDLAAPRLAVYDLRGRRVAAWHLQGGLQWHEWDGRDGEGRRVSAGMYLILLETAGRSAAQKVVWLR